MLVFFHLIGIDPLSNVFDLISRIYFSFIYLYNYLYDYTLKQMADNFHTNS